MAIHSSDLVRAIDTARPAAALCDLEMLIDPLLREIDTGSWTGRQRTEILAARARAPSAGTSRGETSWEGGETFAELQDRVVEALERVASEYGSHEVVAVFAHGGVIRAAVAHAAGGDWRDARRGVAPLIHGSLTVIGRAGLAPRVLQRAARDRAHAPPKRPRTTNEAGTRRCRPRRR